jgi:hypothetical protein
MRPYATRAQGSIALAPVLQFCLHAHEVADSVVLAEHLERGSIRHLLINGHVHLLRALRQAHRVKPVWRVHLGVVRSALGDGHSPYSTTLAGRRTTAALQPSRRPALRWRCCSSHAARRHTATALRLQCMQRSQRTRVSDAGVRCQAVWRCSTSTRAPPIGAHPGHWHWHWQVTVMVMVPASGVPQWPGIATVAVPLSGFLCSPGSSSCTSFGCALNTPRCQSC